MSAQVNVAEAPAVRLDPLLVAKDRPTMPSESVEDRPFDKLREQTSELRAGRPPSLDTSSVTALPGRSGYLPWYMNIAREDQLLPALESCLAELATGAVSFQSATNS